MDSKKMRPSSLLEDDLNWVGPGPSPVPRPISPLSCGGDRPGTTTFASSSHHVLNRERDQDQVLSCVSRETAHEDCARHRFIVWAAVKRNSSKRMTAADRLRCPLFKCAQQFQDHESMLRHLAGCKHLASGEYLCYDHMRVEHFDDVKCKKCLGHPSKRRKMLSMAKNFFHSLGHKSKKPSHGNGLGLDTDNISLMPPPYDSLGITPLNGDNPTELPSTEILEIDSIEVTHSAALNLATTTTTTTTTAEGLIDPQALLVPDLPPSIPELDSSGFSNDALMQWQPTSTLPAAFYSHSGMEDGSARQAISKPTLQVNTYGLHGRRHAPRPVPRPEPPRSKGLSPSSSVRSTASTDTNASAASNMTAASGVSSLISPSSNWSGVWSMGSGMNTNLTTPIDGLLADDAFAEAMNNYEDSCPDYLHNFFSELPAELPATATFSNPKAPEPMPVEPLVSLAIPTPINFPYDTEIVLTESSTDLVELDEPEIEETNVCCSEVKSMVESAWDALQEHIVSSMVKIQDVTNNHLAGQLRTMSTRTIATTALETLRTLLAGGQPSSAGDTLCFVHLIYAFSLVVHEQGASHRAKELFLQSLSYTNSLPLNDRDLYTQLVYAIWQPPDITPTDIRNYFAMETSNSLIRSPNFKGKSPLTPGMDLGTREGDALLVAARNFLDELESSLVLGPTPDSLDIQTSKLFSKHLQDNPSAAVHQAFAITVTYVSSQLIDAFSDARGLRNNVNKIIQRVKTGEICSVRRVEIELLNAGKGCMPPRRFFDDFVPQVREMCDPIYQQHDAGTSRRNDYHCLGITLIATIMPEFDLSPAANSTEHPLDEDLEVNFDEYFNKLTPDCKTGAELAFSGMGTEFDHLLGTSDLRNVQVPLLITTPPDSGNSSIVSQTSTPAAVDNHQRREGDSTTAESSTEQSTNGQKAEANSCCEICGYRPKGDPQWFKGSMAKHKKLQHSTAPPKIYKCPYPGCSSQYRNRPDNLRQHQIEKNHWVGGEEGTQRRPSKRKKLDAEPGEE
ncbi:hypothetical protein V8F20_003824 [Naviculisporaceae sp. PSN 640]